MTYLVTGGTGFIGGHLLGNLLRREGTVHVLVREGSASKVDALRRRYPVGADRIVPVIGDVAQPRLGLSDEQIASLKGKVRHVFHLAAIYDLSADEEDQVRVNIEGTRNAMDAATAIDAGCFHHTSSIAAAGLYEGTWREDMFDEAQDYESDPYFRTKHESEALVRSECSIPWRVYRPGMVIGHSKTGEIDKIDGPYFFFTFLKKMRRLLPPWFPLVGIEGRTINVVPVDYVTDAMDYLAHKPDLDGRAFHLTDPNPHHAGEVINIFAKAAAAPQFSMRLDTRLFNIIPKQIRQLLVSLPPVRKLVNQVLASYGIPPYVMKFVNYPTKFESRATQRELAGSDITCPPLESYSGVVWDYWKRHLDPDLNRDFTLSGNVRDRTVLITGASSGIGLEVARKVASAGGRVLMVARTEETLREVQSEIAAEGGKVWIYPADLSDMEQCDRVVADVLAEHGHVDILINNAGRSIRRSVKYSFDRFHDFERLMQINYFGAIKLIMGFLPQMMERRQGQVINVSSIGVLSVPARFTAYIASKSALEYWSRCAQAELIDKNIRITNINMPLVKTPMIAATSIYNSVPTLTPHEAAELVSKAIIEKPKRIATRLGIFTQVMSTLFPQVWDTAQNTGYKLFPDSPAAKGETGAKSQKPSPEAVAFATLMRGVHW